PSLAAYETGSAMFLLRQSGLHQAFAQMIAVGVLLVVQRRQKALARKVRELFEHLLGVRRRSDLVPQLRERSGKKSVVRVIRPRDPACGLDRFGVLTRR